MIRKPTRKRTDGFSMTELLVALAVIGLMALIATPAIKTYYWGWKIKGTAHTLAIMAQKARLRAASTRAPVSMTFHKEPGSLTVTLQEGTPAGGSLMVQSFTLPKGGGNRVGMGWHLGEGILGGPDLVLTFQTDGAVSTAGGGSPPPRFDIYDAGHTKSVPPAFVRISARGSVIAGTLNIGQRPGPRTIYNPLGYYEVLPSDAHPEELRTGVKGVTSE
ncbi:MAG: prepilin-type N-terminal cleavage/methylation domain-containing protein [Acidobacteria bacterium]|nr:prepilin-type N-terminal cleavage/methylation domain-containing protein [Acidobacteriota bacterium]